MASFLADVHLAKLAKFLRLLGFDTLYFNQIDDNEILRIAKDRWILTKDRELCNRAKRCLLIRSNDPKEQLKEVIDRLKLSQCEPFTRCLVDNEALENVQKEQILSQLPEGVAKWCEEYRRCPKCARIYWPGSHYDRMKSFIDEVCGRIRERSHEDKR